MLFGMRTPYAIIALLAVVTLLGAIALYSSQSGTPSPVHGQPQPATPLPFHVDTPPVAQTSTTAAVESRTYTDPLNGFAIDYPAASYARVLQQPDQGGDDCPVAGICISYSGTPYDHTTFAGATLAVGIAGAAVTTEAQCYSFGTPESGIANQSTILIGRVVFRTATRGSAAGGHGMSSFIRRAWRQNRCYEIRTTIVETTGLIGEVPRFTEDDSKQVEASLDAVAATFRVLP
jgi:hypothetical protein